MEQVTPTNALVETVTLNPYLTPAPSSSITLLFQNTTKLNIPISSAPETIFALKEHLLNNWSTDYENDDSETLIDEAQIRLIHMGRILTDNTQIKDLNISISDVIHVTVRPIAAIRKKKKRFDSFIDSGAAGIVGRRGFKSGEHDVMVQPVSGVQSRGRAGVQSVRHSGGISSAQSGRQASVSAGHSGNAHPVNNTARRSEDNGGGCCTIM